MHHPYDCFYFPADIKQICFPNQSIAFMYLAYAYVQSLLQTECLV